jgi:hypothetical protein
MLEKLTYDCSDVRNEVNAVFPGYLATARKLLEVRELVFDNDSDVMEGVDLYISEITKDSEALLEEYMTWVFGEEWYDGTVVHHFKKFLGEMIAECIECGSTGRDSVIRWAYNRYLVEVYVWYMRIVLEREDILHANKKKLKEVWKHLKNLFAVHGTRETWLDNNGSICPKRDKAEVTTVGVDNSEVTTVAVGAKRARKGKRIKEENSEVIPVAVGAKKARRVKGTKEENSEVIPLSVGAKRALKAIRDEEERIAKEENNPSSPEPSRWLLKQAFRKPLATRAKRGKANGARSATGKALLAKKAKKNIRWLSESVPNDWF